MAAEFLVTAAAGRTGGETARALLARGSTVRGLVRRDDHRADELRELGVEVVVGDYHDLAAISAALRGVRGAYLTYPVADGLVDATVTFAQAATAGGVSTIVNMSQIVAGADAPSPTSRRHWLAERVLDWAEPDAVHIRPSWFAEMPFMLSLTSIVDDHRFVLPWGSAPSYPVSIADIGRTVAAILLSPDGHAGRTHTLTGTDRVTPADTAAVIGEALGHAVTYDDIDFETWGGVLSAFGLPLVLIEHLGKVCEQQRNGVFDQQTDAVESITGARPTAYRDVIAGNVARIPAMTAAASETLARLAAG